MGRGKPAAPRAHAIEVRITAEDPAADFAPTPGRVRRWIMPAGPGVRVDTAIEAGDQVPPDYDNLIAKIMVVGVDRSAAIDRLRRALDETEIAGIQTTLPFHRFVARSPSFAAAELSTGWVGEHWDGPASFAGAVWMAQLAAGLDALEVGLPTAVSLPTAANGRWPGAPGGNTPLGWERDDDAWAATGRHAATDRWPR